MIQNDLQKRNHPLQLLTDNLFIYDVENFNGSDKRNFFYFMNTADSFQKNRKYATREQGEQTIYIYFQPGCRNRTWHQKMCHVNYEK